MARLTLESLFDPVHLDALFHTTATVQYEKELLFSEIAELMLSVVLRVDASVHAAYQKRAGGLGVSDQAIYDKLQCMELGVSAALVADSAQRLAPVIEELGGRSLDWIPGYRTRVLDGCHLSQSQRRIKELRSLAAAALPGTAVAVYEPAVDLVTHVCLTPDGHAQERSVTDEIMALVDKRDLWIADRNFCTFRLLWGLAARQACFAIRQHATLPCRLLGRRRYRGRTDTGRVYEQDVCVALEGQSLRLRRVSVLLDQPTRDGDTEIHIVTNLPAKQADAVKVAELYRKRWTIEGRFYEVTQTLNCEPNALGYPKAALFAFCLALVASNAVALLRAALRSVHAPEAVEDMSRYYVALEIRETYIGMMIALPPAKWVAFAQLDPTSLAKVLSEAAQHVRPEKYRKAKRGPKKKRPPLKGYHKGGHVSTHKLLQKRRQ